MPHPSFSLFCCHVDFCFFLLHWPLMVPSCIQGLPDNPNYSPLFLSVKTTLAFGKWHGAILWAMEKGSRACCMLCSLGGGVCCGLWQSWYTFPACPFENSVCVCVELPVSLGGMFYGFMERFKYTVGLRVTSVGGVICHSGLLFLLWCRWSRSWKMA